MIANSKFTREELLEVPCMCCYAKIGEECRNLAGQSLLVGFHTERQQLRAKLPSPRIDDPFTADEKAIIIGYAFIMLCDSCSTASVKLFGKQLTSEDIQRHFAHEAMKSLKADDLIG